jgi:hypothetical protein
VIQKQHLMGAVALAALPAAAAVWLRAGEAPQPQESSTVAALRSPAPAGSAQPLLALAGDGSVMLSWLEPADEQAHRFRFATLAPDASAWGPPRTIHEGPGFFANWADVPSIAAAPDGLLAAHWLQVSGPAPYAYDVKVRTSRDGGRSWSEVITPHRDGTQTEHGFASFVPWPDGGLAIAWLDGRDFAQHGGEGHGDDGMKGQMALRAARISHGQAGEEVVLDTRVCDCCPTTAARTARGIALAYRDRSDDEIRDIYVTRYENGRWTEGRPVARDNWQIAGCPVNGPAISARGDALALAWFAAPDSVARVSVAFSQDGAETFGTPIRVDDGMPLGRVAVTLLADGTAIVGWIERLEKGAEFRVRRVHPNGRRDDARTIAALDAGRSSGYPRLALSGDRLVFAWVEADGVKTATARLE